MNDQKWKSEFEEFKNATGVTPPKEVSERIIALVEKDLKVSPWGMFSKLSLIHLFSALFTLSICPQFGFRVLGDGMGLMHYFMSLGSFGCPMACGSFFLGTSLLVATILLKGHELRALRSHRFAELGALTLLSLGFFIMVDPSSVVTSFTLAWVLGSLTGGAAVLEIGWRVCELRRT
ncbi:MAG: hypothetical protein KGQ59_00040 [Bdellovibrionales bacterium]|nr:hypothetical protein [Bdellovibrionales bacterium]